MFKQFANSIVDVHLLKDGHTGERIPTGFVQFNSLETAKEALEATHGTLTPYGETLIVSYARARRFTPGFDQGSRQGSSGNNRNRSRGSSSSRSRWG